MAVKLKQAESLGALSITPLIDVVFLLLIFFLVATRFEQQDREMDFPLPDASMAQPASIKPREVFINIDNNGRYFVGGKQVTLAELKAVLMRAVANNPLHQSAMVRADRRVQLQPVVSAINTCKEVGCKVAITIEGKGG